MQGMEEFYKQMKMIHYLFTSLISKAFNYLDMISGGPGLVCFPKQYLYKDELWKELQKLHENKKY